MSPPTRVETPFGEHSTADEVVAGADLTGRRAIVTGASSGIGAETARVLADHGAAVTLAVRDTGAGESVAAAIRASTGNDDVDVRRLELADPASVAAFIDAWDGPLDILVNNAGVMAIPERTLTADGTRASLRDQPPRAFLVGHGSPRCAARSGQRSCRLAVLERAPLLPGAV